MYTITATANSLFPALRLPSKQPPYFLCSGPLGKWICEGRAARKVGTVAAMEASFTKNFYLNRLLTTINKCGISFSLWEKKDADGRPSGLYDWTSLMGKEKKDLMLKLTPQLPCLLKPETAVAVVKVWEVQIKTVTITDIKKKFEQSRVLNKYTVFVKKNATKGPTF